MLGEVCSQVSGRSTNPRARSLSLLSGASNRRLNIFAVKLVGHKTPHSHVALLA